MKKKLSWTIEVTLWLVAICAISFVIVFFKSLDDQKQHSYYLFFEDVDGLMQGSPVRLMGMKIGYVQDIRVFDNSVFVSFLVTDNRATIPEPAVATVEFYGLGGSKSLEIMPAENASRIKEGLIQIKEPYRIQKFYDVQNNIAKTIVVMGNSFSQLVQESNIYEMQELLKMSGKVKDANTQLKNLPEFQEMLKGRKITKGENDVISEEENIE